jgi:hypothetical protein
MNDVTRKNPRKSNLYFIIAALESEIVLTVILGEDE